MATWRIGAAVLLLSCASFPLLGQEIDSENPRDRARAARALGEEGSAGIPALRILLKDAEYDVRLEAVKSVVRIGTQYSLDPLIEATRDADPEIQIRATDGLVNFYSPGYINRGISGSLRRAGRSIRARFTDVNDLVIPLHVQVRPEVIQALGDLARGGSDMTSRANAARAVGILRGQQAVPDLLEALRSKDSDVLYESLIALQKIRDTSAGPGVMFLLRDLDERVQIAAIETVGLLRTYEAVPRLQEVLADTRNNRVRRAALTSLAMVPEASSRPIYQRYLSDDDAMTRAAAAEGFARLKNPDDRAMIEARYRDEGKMNPRLSLAFAAVMLGNTAMDELSPLRYLVNTLNSASFHGVSDAFLIELAREPEVREALYPVLRSGTNAEKIRLAQVLARSGDAQTVPHLETLLGDRDPDVTKEAAEALLVLRSRI